MLGLDKIQLVAKLREYDKNLVYVNTMRKWQNQGSLQRYRIGPRGDRRFRLEELERFLVENTLLFGT
jgi:hypothetical protein